MSKLAPLTLERSVNPLEPKTLILDFPAQGGVGGDYSIKVYRHKFAAGSQDEIHIALNAIWDNATSLWEQDDPSEYSLLIRIGGMVSIGQGFIFEGKTTSSGTWADNAWDRALSIVPTNGGRAVLLDDTQISWENTTTGSTGANPPAATVLQNVLTAKNVVKAWGLVQTSLGSGQVIHDGFGISSAGVSGTDLEIGFSALMSSTDYAVVVTENSGSLNGLIPVVTYMSGTAFRIRMTHHDGTVYNADGITSWFAGFIVMGLHNT